jgi:hypothetical protein
MALKSALKAFALSLPLSLVALGAFAANENDPYDDEAQYSSQEEDPSFDRDRARRSATMRVGLREILTPDSVARGLRRSDYSNVHRVIYTGIFYTAAATDIEGRKVTLQIDAVTGEIIGVDGQKIQHASWRGERSTFTRATRRIDTQGDAFLARGDVRETLTDQGYTDLGWIREVGNVFIVKARDTSGERVELTIDGFTGQVIDTDYI